MRSNQKSGFTLIELMLAMTFFATILTISTAVFVQMLNTYNKGLAVKQMNQVGRTLTDEFSRLSNSGLGFGVANADDAPADQTRVRCMRVGSEVYVWSYADDVVTNPKVYTVDGLNPINMSKLIISYYQGCPSSRDATYDASPAPKKFIAADNLIPVLSSNVRVYDAHVKLLKKCISSVANQTCDEVTLYDNAYRVSFTFGTYAGAGSSANPTITGGVPSCPVSSIGNFCAFGTHETVLYLPNGI